MPFHIVGLVCTYVLAAVFSASVAMVPAATAWGSIWTYIAFAVWIIPGYITAWVLCMLLILLFTLLGMGAFVGTLLGTAWVSDKINKHRGPRF